MIKIAPFTENSNTPLRPLLWHIYGVNWTYPPESDTYEKFALVSIGVQAECCSDTQARNPIVTSENLVDSTIFGGSAYKSTAIWSVRSMCACTALGHWRQNKVTTIFTSSFFLRSLLFSSLATIHRVVRGKTGHFLNLLAFDQIKTRIIDIFTCAFKHCLYWLYFLV